MTFPTSGARKLALDEESFQQLLAAAYALQENKDVLRAGSSENDSASAFSEIAALRSQILVRVGAGEPHIVNPKNAEAKAAAEAAALVADCLRRLTKADGASVCLIVGGYLRSTACSGIAAKVSGGSVASNSLIATERLRNGRAFQSANACSDIRLDPAQCVKLKIGSLLAVPITVKSDVAGLIELRWSKAEAFRDGDEHICQLLVELMSEVLDSDAGQVNAQVAHPVQVTPARRAIPKLVTPVVKSETQDQELPSTPAIEDAQSTSSDNICRVCGKPLHDDLNFCGNCGMLSDSPDNGLQGKWASMWFMQQAQKAVETGEGRGERPWPLHAEANAGGAASAASVTESSSDHTETDETGETSPNSKRNPRNVLSVLKSRFRARAMGR